MKHTITLLLLFAACTGTPKGERSGFLEDYSVLEPSEYTKGALVYRSGKGKNYDIFIVDPVVAYFHPNAKGRAIDPDELEDITKYFRSQFIDVLTDGYRVVQEPGPGVLRISIAITDLHKTQAALNVVPATKLSGLGLGGAALEMKATDSETGELIFAGMDARGGDRVKLKGSTEKWGHAKQVARFWAARLKQRLDEVHGR